MIWRNLGVGVAVLALAAVTLACNIGLGGPTPPGSPIPVSSEAAGQLEGIILTAIANAVDGNVTIVMTEEQVTSYMALRLATNEEVPFKDVQIYLRNGQMILYGNATVRGISVPALVTFEPVTTADGALAVEIVDADFGPVSVPASLTEQLSAAFNEMVTGQLGTQATGVRVTGATISDGQMTLTGTITR